MVLHMLRYLFSVQKGTDDAFFPMLRDFLQIYKYQAASTPDFRKVAEKHFGQSLEWFFDQWIEDGGIPVLKWGHDIVQEGGATVLRLEARQEQKKYRLVVPIYIHFPGDKVVVRPWVIEGESATRSLKLPSRPDSVSLNDNLEALVILKNLRAL
jgi:aminopeptidase N